MKKRNLWKNTRSYFNPFNIYYYLLNSRLYHFILVGGTGVLLNLGLTIFFAEFVFGRQDYFYAYLIGLFSNLAYNFSLHSLVTFKTQDSHLLRFFIFIIYNLLISGLQAFIIKSTVDILGIDYYILVILGVIGTFFLINFLISKLWLFKNFRENIK